MKTYEPKYKTEHNLCNLPTLELHKRPMSEQYKLTVFCQIATNPIGYVYTDGYQIYDNNIVLRDKNNEVTSRFYFRKLYVMFDEDEKHDNKR